MKLVSFEVASPMGPSIRVGAIDEAGRIVDLAAAYRLALLDEGVSPEAARRISEALLPGDMVGLIEGGEPTLNAARAAVARADASMTTREGAAICFSPQDVRMRPPIPRPPLLRDFMGFETHLRNIFPTLGREIPPVWYELPVYYKGNPGSIGADGDDIAIPSYGEVLDFEFELAFVIGRGGMNIPVESARDHIFGYMVYNDFSERRIQAREMTVGLGPAKGKDFSRAHVLGPCLVTADEIHDIYDLRMIARVNGEVWCDTNSGTRHWTFEQMIAHASMDEYLHPGEVLGSGTVGGGSGAERGTFLKRGDLVELEVESLGVVRNRIV